MRLRSLVHRVRISQNLRLPFLAGSYKYSPLSSPTCVRLLEFIPSADPKTICCSLKAVELQDAPPFRALSYTWGEATTTLKPSTPNAPRRRNVRLMKGCSTLQGVRQHPIICDGKVVKVTSNLRDALRMLMNTTNLPKNTLGPRYFWIDMLCMNQEDIDERNTQVARMADVFKRADGVIIWLGKEDEFTKDALTTIRKISALPEEQWPSVPYTSFYEYGEGKSGHKVDLTFYDWLGFIVLINRPWFKRVWVVQEIALSKSALVFCGTEVLSWEMLSKTLSFVKATKWYHHLYTEKMKHIKTLQKHPGIYKRVLQSKLCVGIGPVYLNETRLTLSASTKHTSGQLTQPPPLRMLLDKHRFSKSSDPRDKVYALVGLASRSMAPFVSQPKVLIPDYNLSVQEVFIETARVLMTSYKNLSWLSHVEDPSQRRISGLPSWVPDLSVSLDPYPIRYRGPVFWRAAGQRKWRPDSINMSKGKLRVQGHRIDDIDQTSVLVNESKDPSAAWASIVKLVLSLDLPYPAPEQRKKVSSRIELLWRVLTTDVYAHTYPAPPEVGSLFIDYILNLQIRHRLMPWSSADEFQPHHSPLSDSMHPEWRTLLNLEPADSPYCLDQYTRRLTNVVESMFNGTYSPIGLAQLQHELEQSGGSKRRLFKTRAGFMGTGPRSLRKGDEVWVLYRGSLPFVLRPLENGNFSLIGESFVYGIMHGECLDMDLPLSQITIE